MLQRYAQPQLASPIVSGHVSFDLIRNPNSIGLNVQIVTGKRS